MRWPPCCQRFEAPATPSGGLQDVGRNSERTWRILYNTHLNSYSCLKGKHPSFLTKSASKLQPGSGSLKGQCFPLERWSRHMQSHMAAKKAIAPTRLSGFQLRCNTHVTMWTPTGVKTSCVCVCVCDLFFVIVILYPFFHTLPPSAPHPFVEFIMELAELRSALGRDWLPGLHQTNNNS